jgi:DNA-binding NarL/FixJ family response regulator
MHPEEALEAGADGIVDKVALPQEIADRVREAVVE